MAEASRRREKLSDESAKHGKTDVQSKRSDDPDHHSGSNQFPENLNLRCAEALHKDRVTLPLTKTDPAVLKRSDPPDGKSGGISFPRRNTFGSEEGDSEEVTGGLG